MPVNINIEAKPFILAIVVATMLCCGLDAWCQTDYDNILRYDPRISGRDNPAVAVLQGRTARFTIDGLVYSNWNAPYVTFDSITDKNCIEVFIPDTVSNLGRKFPVFEIGHDAFRNCPYLVKVSLPSVYGVLAGAFKGCSSLRVIEVRAKVPPLVGEHGFYGGKPFDIFENYFPYTAVLVVPKGCEEAYRKAVGWGEFKTIISHEPSLDELNIDEITMQINERESRLSTIRQEAARLEQEINALKKAQSEVDQH